jgi:hypothetical protein
MVKGVFPEIEEGVFPEMEEDVERQRQAAKSHFSI